MERDDEPFTNDGVAVFGKHAAFFVEVEKTRRERDHFRSALERIASGDYRGPKPSIVQAAQVALLQAQEGQV